MAYPELIFTYEDLLLELLKLTTEQLQHRAQVVLFDETKLGGHVGQSIVCLGTVEDLGLENVQSSEDGRHNPDEVVLLVDDNDYEGQRVITLV